MVGIQLTESMSRNKSILTWLPCLFIIAIFLGDVWLKKLTLPFSMLLIPLFILTYSPTKIFSLKNIPYASYFLFGLVAIIILQLLLNKSINVRSDLAVWDPVLFAITTIFCLRDVCIPEVLFKKSLYAGGILTGVMMVGVIIFASPGVHLLPGQNTDLVERNYLEQSKKYKNLRKGDFKNTQNTQNPQGLYSFGITEEQMTREAFVPGITEEQMAFYRKKSKVKNFLGSSNFIATFLVLIFSVALFAEDFLIAVFMVGLIVLSMSRFGELYLIIASGAFLAYKLKYDQRKLAICMLAGTTVTFGLLMLFKAPILHSLTSPSGLARFKYWVSGLSVAMHYPLTGSPRSSMLLDFNYSISWNPHNALFYINSYFGLIGVFFYIAYVFQVLKTISKAAVNSKIWTGVFIGVTIMLSWSFVEIVVLTPAFEILLATVYILARNSVFQRGNYFNQTITK